MNMQDGLFNSIELKIPHWCGTVKHLLSKFFRDNRHSEIFQRNDCANAL